MEQVVEPFIRMWIIPVIGIISYILLLVITSKLLHRQVTSELFIIVGWTVLELCFVNAMYRCSVAGKQAVIGLIAGIITQIHN